MLSQDHGAQFRREPGFGHDFYRLFVADFAGGNCYRLTLALSGNAFDRLRSQVFMFYLLAIFFALLSIVRFLGSNNHLFFQSLFTRRAQLNDLRRLFPVAFTAYHLCSLAAGSEDVLRMRSGIVDKDGLWAIHLHCANTVQVGFAPGAALAVS